ncbi:MAG: zf-TFIIB domain-containing protein [Vicinamibacterales bacterium]
MARQDNFHETCPACGAAMAEQRLEGQYGRSIDIDLCAACSGLWLDGMENHQLSPRATLALFRSMAAAPAGTIPLQPRKRCPRCGLRLKDEVGKQRSTRSVRNVGVRECATGGVREC